MTIIDYYNDLQAAARTFTDVEALQGSVNWVTENAHEDHDITDDEYIRIVDMGEAIIAENMSRFVSCRRWAG